MLYIGIDLGTSATKLLLVDEKGKIHKMVTKEYPLSFPQPGWSEQDPGLWKEALVKGIKELTAECDKSQIAGIGAGGQMHGLVLLDEEDKVLRPAILWNDGRTQGETDWLNSKIGKEKLVAYTGNIAFAGFTAPKILWVRDHEPEIFARIHKIMLPKDYINYLLTGVHCTDYSDASGMLLLDVEKKQWSQEMVEICGIREAQLPRLFESYEIVGEVLPAMAEELGLPPQVKVAAGAGDNAAAAIGTGIVDGACNISLGTSGTLFIASDEFPKGGNPALHAFAHADGGFHLMGCMLSAASCNKWWIEEILKSGDYAGEQGGISKEKMGCNRVYYLPYLMGERAPHNDAAARAAFVGLSMDNTREDMTQAVMEGVAFGMRDSLEAAREMGLSISTSMICGGGARSQQWKEIFANVLNLTLTEPETEQGPGFGGAILAMVGSGRYGTVKEAAKDLVTVNREIRPDSLLVERYEKRYREYKKLYPALKQFYAEQVD